MGEEVAVAEKPPETDKPKTKEPVLVTVNKPEDWPEAKDVKSTVEIETLNGIMEFDIRALSYGEDEELEERLHRPTAPEENASVAEKAIYAEQLRDLWMARIVSIIDMCWQPLPGDNISDKIKWSAENFRRNGELEYLSNLILSLSGMNGGQIEPNVAAPKVKADPANWAKQSQARTNYLISRAGVTLAFPMVGLSQLKQNQIQAATRPPQPPERPKKHRLTGRVEGMEPNLNDPGYKKACTMVAEQRKVLQLEAALPFELPGADLNEKYAWLRKRPAYEIISLLGHLYHNLTGYRTRKDFF